MIQKIALALTVIFVQTAAFAYVNEENNEQVNTGKCTYGELIAAKESILGVHSRPMEFILSYEVDGLKYSQVRCLGDGIYAVVFTDTLATDVECPLRVTVDKYGFVQPANEPLTCTKIK